MNFLLLKRKFLIAAISIIILLIFSNTLFAYDEIIVHPTLTSEMAKLYNLNFGEKLTDQEIEWMKKGAKDEDDRQGLLIRSGNHFYNPFGIKKWADNTLIGNSVPEPKLTFKEWLHDSLEQDSFPGGDFTWERGIWDYANGDKQHAYESLGHVMHLIEDATVPAHVRNDLHISPSDKDLAPYQNIPSFSEIKKYLQDGEPYESWTGGKAWGRSLNYDFADNLFKENKKPISLDNIDEYFDNIAKYTNTNFFSKDTIYAYSEPNKHAFEGSEKTIDGKIIEYVYIEEDGKKLRLAKIFEDLNTRQRFYDVSDDTPEIHSDYWSHLAPRAVLTGAGIIKLFKDEANKAAQNPELIERPKSIASLFGPLAPKIKKIDPAIRTIDTIAELQANAEIYFFKKALAAIKNSTVSVYNSAKSSAIAIYNWSINSATVAYNTVKNTAIAAYNTARKTAVDTYNAAKNAAVSVYNFAASTAVSAYNSAKNATVTVFNATKTGLSLAKEYAFDSAVGAGNFFKTTLNSATQYFTSTAKAQLEFDISKPVIGGYSIEEILKDINLTEKAQVVSPVLADYAAQLILIGSGQATSAPGEPVALQAKIKNIGVSAWQGEKVSLNVYVEADLAKKFHHSSWLTDVRPADLGKIAVLPQQTGTFDFLVTAPQAEGDYTFRVRAVRQDENSNFFWLGENTISWPIKVQAQIPKTELPVSAPAFDGADNNIASMPFSSPNPIPLASALPLAPIAYVGTSGWSSASVPLPAVSQAVDPTPTPTPSVTPTPTPSVTPTPTPSVSPTPTPSVSPTPTPTPSVSPTPTPILDVISPETIIVEYPENQTRETAAGFRFSSSEENSTFLCSLDSGEFAECGEFTIIQGLMIGRHALIVKAKDESGNIDETPAEYSWTIIKPPHLVISEIQTAGITSDDEFIELYNSTKNAINLAGWSIQYRGGEAENYYKKNFGDDDVVLAEGYFLIARKDKYAGAVLADMTWGTPLSAEGGTVFIVASDILLTAETDTSEDVIDRVSWGMGKDNYLRSETKEFTPVPESGQSIERKANHDSTIDTMSIGTDRYLGNGWDSDDNSADFVLRAFSEPQNSKSFSEPRYAPEKISDFSAIISDEDIRAVKLAWSAPYGANGAVENLAYDIHFSDSEITEDNFSFAAIAPNIPAVKEKGEKQELKIGNLELDKIYYFAIKTKDNTGLESGIASAQYAFSSAQALSPWPTFKGNNRRTGQSVYLGAQTASLKWKYATGGWVINSPSIGADSSVYLWSHEGSEAYGNIASLGSNGVLKWKYPTPYFTNTPALDSKGDIYFAYQAMIQKNNWQDGNFMASVWTGTNYYGAAALSSVLVSSDNTVYFSSRETLGYLFAVDSDLKEKWKKYLEGEISSGPSEDKIGNIYAGTVIIAAKVDSESGSTVFDKENSFYRLFSFDKNGDERWSVNLAGLEEQYRSSGFYAPAIGDNTGYVAANNTLYAFDLNDGLKRWNYDFASMGIAAGPVSLSDNETIYFVSSDGYIYAISSSGSLKWKYKLANSIEFWYNCYSLTSPAIGFDGTIYVGGENAFFALNSDGTEKWRYEMPKDPRSPLVCGGSPAIGKNGEVYVSFSDYSGSVLYVFSDN